MSFARIVKAALKSGRSKQSDKVLDWASICPTTILIPTQLSQMAAQFPASHPWSSAWRPTSKVGSEHLLPLGPARHCSSQTTCAVPWDTMPRAQGFKDSWTVFNFATSNQSCNSLARCSRKGVLVSVLHSLNHVFSIYVDYFEGGTWFFYPWPCEWNADFVAIAGFAWFSRICVAEILMRVSREEINLPPVPVPSWWLHKHLPAHMRNLRYGEL